MGKKSEVRVQELQEFRICRMRESFESTWRNSEHHLTCET